MIVYEFHYWTGDRKADTVTNEFIINEEMARAKAIQELCEYYKIVISKTLHCTLTLDLDVSQSRYLNIPMLGLEGPNWINDITTTLSPQGCYEDVIVENYKDMELPA